MKLIDITRTVQQAPVYPGSAPPVITRVTDIDKGDMYNYSMITMDSHAGTHCDAFSHFLQGEAGIDEMALSFYYGPCSVTTVPAETPVTRELLVGKIEHTERLVLHTGGAGYLTKCGAEYLVECGVFTVVTDAPSISPLDNEAELHKILLGAGIAVIENAILDSVPDGDYILSAFPIKLGGCDGAPVRAILVSE